MAGKGRALAALVRLAPQGLPQSVDMGESEPGEATEKPDPAKLAQDPERLREAHKKYGDYLRKVGLPFEDDEFDEEAPSEQPSDASSDEAAK